MSSVLPLPDLFDVPDLATPEAFVAWMETQPRKLEMAGGRLVMMAGGTNAHATIAGNLWAALRTRLRGGPCRPYNSDFMVQLGPQDRYYPDASVACGETRDYTDRPVLVVEVLSASTRRFDLQVKLPAYLRAPGLRHILYLSQDEPRAWLYGPDGDEPAELAGLAAVVELPALGLRLPLAELYEDVTSAGTEA
jgi:Uma2 family endonuclease